MLWKRKDADMTMGKMVAAVLAVILIVVLIMLAFRAGVLGSKSMGCAEGEDFCVKTVAECEAKGDEYEFKTLKYCKTSDDEDGKCCERALSLD